MGLFIKQNGQLTQVGSGTRAGAENPMTNTGDLIVGGASGTPTRLGIGTNGQVLKSNGTTAVLGDPNVSVQKTLSDTVSVTGYVKNGSLVASGSWLTYKYDNTNLDINEVLSAHLHTNDVTIDAISFFTNTTIGAASYISGVHFEEPEYTNLANIIVPANAKMITFSTRTADATDESAVLIGSPLVTLERKIEELESQLLAVDGMCGYIRNRGAEDPTYVTKLGNVDGVLSHFKLAMVKDGILKYFVNQTNINVEENGAFSSILDGTDGDLLVVNDIPIYYLFDTDSAFDISLFSTKPFTYDGKAAQKLEPRGDAPSIAYIDNINSGNSSDHAAMLGSGKAHYCRNSSYVAQYNNMIGMVGKYVPSQSGSTISYTYDSAKAFIDTGAYRPTAYLDQSTAEKAATNKNTGSIIYTNKDVLSKEIAIEMMYSDFGTRFLQDKTLCGSPYNGTRETIDESLFTNGTNKLNGFRYKDGNNTWQYSSITGITFKDGSNNNVQSYTMLTNWNSPWEIMEQHLVASYAVANSIAENTWFVYNENEYKYLNIGTKNLLTGNEMTCCIFKKFRSKLNNIYLSGTNLTGNDIEWVIFSTLYRGLVMDVSPHYWLTGISCVLRSDEPLHYYWYVERDYKKYLMQKTYQPITLSQYYDFEKQYQYAGEYSTPSDAGTTYYYDHSDQSVLIGKTTYDAYVANKYDCSCANTSIKVANSTNYPNSHTYNDGVTSNTKIVTGVKCGYGPSDGDRPYNYLYAWHPREYVVAMAGYSSFVCQNVNCNNLIKDDAITNVTTKTLAITSGGTTVSYNVLVKE